jgi:hypothetical protein
LGLPLGSRPRAHTRQEENNGDEEFHRAPLWKTARDSQLPVISRQFNGALNASLLMVSVPFELATGN